MAEKDEKIKYEVIKRRLIPWKISLSVDRVLLNQLLKPTHGENLLSVNFIGSVDPDKGFLLYCTDKVVVLSFELYRQS